MPQPGPSRIELAIRQIKTILTPTDGINGRIWRDREEAFNVERELPALVIYPERSLRIPATTCRDLWDLVVMVDICVAGGPVSELADPIWCDVHARLMVDPMGLEPAPPGEGRPPALQWIRVDGEGRPGILSTAWLVQVRTMGGDVTMP